MDPPASSQMLGRHHGDLVMLPISLPISHCTLYDEKPCVTSTATTHTRAFAFVVAVTGGNWGDRGKYPNPEFRMAGRRGSLTEELAAGFRQQQLQQEQQQQQQYASYRRSARPGRTLALLPRQRWIAARVSEILGFGDGAEVEYSLSEERHRNVVDAFLSAAGPATIYVFFQVRATNLFDATVSRRGTECVDYPQNHLCL